MDRLKAETSFEQKMKVAELIEVYNFHEENFFKLKIDLKIKLDLKNCAGNRKFLHRILETVYEQAIPAHALTTEFMELFSKIVFRI